MRGGQAAPRTAADVFKALARQGEPTAAREVRPPAGEGTLGVPSACASPPGPWMARRAC